MNVHTSISKSIIDTALHRARTLDENSPLSGLNAPLDADVSGLLSQAWDYVEALAHVAFQNGKELARDAIESTIKKLNDLFEVLGEQASDAIELFKAKLREYYQGVIDGVLSLISSEILIGGKSMSVSKVQLAQKFSLGGNWKMALTDIISLTANGEYSVSVEYTA